VNSVTYSGLAPQICFALAATATIVPFGLVVLSNSLMELSDTGDSQTNRRIIIFFASLPRVSGRATFV